MPDRSRVMQHLLRAISGPLAGAVYVLGPRTTLGRASDCDIQVLHEGVSRQHAKITLGPQGAAVLIDLGSDNGTFVENEQVVRHELQPGEMVRIMGSQFVYEVLQNMDAVTSAAFQRKVTSGDSLRQTANLGRELSGFRSGGTAARSAGLAGTERGRSHSRSPGEVAAPSGARPGALSTPTSGSSPMTGAPTPESADEPEPDDDESPGARTIGYGEERRFPFSTPPSGEAGGSYGWHASRTEERERVTITPASLARAVTPLGNLPEPEDLDALAEPSADDAPVSVGGLLGGEPDAERRPTEAREQPQSFGHDGEEPIDRPAIASPRSESTAARGRAAPLPESPGGMRPRGTMAGIPPVQSDEPSGPSPAAGPSRAEPTPVEHTGRWYARPPSPAMSGDIEAASRRKGITAEYGTMRQRADAERDSGTRGSPVGAPGAGAPGGADPESMPRLVARPAAPGEGARLRPWRSRPRPAPEDDSDLDPDGREQTLPRVRRTKPADAPASAQARATEVAESRARDGASPEPTPEPAGLSGQEVEESLTSGSMEPVEQVEPERTLDLDGLDFDDDDDSADSVEDTLRFHRVDPKAIDEQLHPSEAEDEERADARSHPLESSGGPELEEILEAVADGGNASLPDDLSEIERVEVRAQELLEAADREHGQRIGLSTLVDILEYRELRLRSLRGDVLEPVAVERYSALEGQLQQGGDQDEMAAMRRYHRFSCVLPAQLTRREGGSPSSTEIELLDLSAGGAKIVFGEASLGIGEVVWLTLGLLEAERGRLPRPDADVVVLAARVVWTRPRDAEVGLVFAGAPRYEQDVGVGA